MTDADVVREALHEFRSYAPDYFAEKWEAETELVAALAALDRMEAHIETFDEAAALEARAEIERLREQIYMQRHESNIVLFAVVMAAGGQVVVPHKLFVDDGVLERREDIVNDKTEFRCTPTQEEADG